MSYTTLVNVDADTPSKLVEFVGDLCGDEVFKKDCHALVGSGDGAALVERILSKEKLIFAMEEELDVEGCVMTIASVMLIFENEADSVVKKFIEVLSGARGAEDNVFLRMKLMCTLFNMLSAPAAKFMVITSLLNYALETNQEKEVVTFVSRVEQWADSWKLEGAKRQEVSLLAYKVAKKISDAEDIASGMGGGGSGSGSSSSSSRESVTSNRSALKFLISYLKSFPVGGVLPDEAARVVIPHIVDALKNAASSSFDQRRALHEGLQQSAASSSGDPVKSLLTLLGIICSGDKAQYDSFAKANAGVFKEHGLDQEDISNTIRLLSLSSLACTKSCLTYAEIASALGIPADEVEMVVVEAVGQGMIEATMDQFDQCITVTKCTHRSIGPQQWTELQSRLKALRANVSSVFDEMKKN